MTTASFDCEQQSPILPIWKTASNTVYDLLVGQKLDTHYIHQTNLDGDRGFVNVLEDVRIEKLMKRTYPGFVKVS